MTTNQAAKSTRTPTSTQEVGSEVLTIELMEIIPLLASINAWKDPDAGDDLPKACFKQIAKRLEHKNRTYLFLKDPDQPLPPGQPTQPNDYWPEAADQRESFNMFSRVSCIGCCESENKAAALAIYMYITGAWDGIERRLVYHNTPVVDFGLCISKISTGLLSLVYEWDLSGSTEDWDAVHQADEHIYIYFKLPPMPNDPQSGLFIYDLSALQYGICETPITMGLPVPYVFGEMRDVSEAYPEVYEQYEIFKNRSALGESCAALPGMIEEGFGTESPEGIRQLQLLLHNMAKFKEALQGIDEAKNKLKSQ